ncbi:patatin [Aquimarina sp. AD10]|uniref:patatin-like phospholipase family protein n=1 Tax=Aquimarina sp. AD10 TaxID=1714849 RepID=UPI000E4780BD|nr:patatin-like phospholipase family protein [Aquimarina sp. AD10]AXT61389.1 patatin [Aquimarina sp. AD10]RKN01417.1 patatin [Aquimarina sp. AD10]
MIKDKKKVRILSLDGGGIRGIIPALIIKYAEEYLQKKVPGSTIADHFDFIAGTSTGGILSGMYLTPQSENKNKAKYSASEALDFYVDEGPKIFNDSRVSNWKRLWGLTNATEYNPRNLEQVLKEMFGELVMSELIKPCMVTTYNMNTKSSFFFTSIENTSKREFLVRDVLRSTSAAPTYFPPAVIKNKAPKPKLEETQMRNIDGGVFANNPLLCAYAEVRNTHFRERNNKEPSASDMYVLSIGTGAGDAIFKKTQKSHKWGLLRWAKSIPEIMMDASIDTVSYQMKEIFDTLQPDDLGSLLRIDTPNEAKNYDLDMTNASKDNIERLLEAGEKTLEHARANGLDAFLDGLLDMDNKNVQLKTMADEKTNR